MRTDSTLQGLVIFEEYQGLIRLCGGYGLPSTIASSANRFSSGCIYQDFSAGKVYRNQSSLSSPDWANIDNSNSYFATVGFSDADYVVDPTGANADIQINAALLACNASGGGEVLIKPGNYTISQDIRLKTNTYLKGCGVSTVLNLDARKYIKIDNCSYSGVSNFRVDAINHLTAFFDKAIRILDSDNIRVEKIIGTNLNAFGVFTEASGSNVTSKVWIKECELYGLGNNDIIGGGPQNSTGARVEYLYVQDNYVYQDSSLGTNYATGIDIVALNHSTITNNKVWGNLILGNEQFPHSYCSILGNIVHPANGNSFCYISVQTTTGATLPVEEINVSNNILDNGYIYVYGVAAAFAKNIVISGNNIKWVGAQGIKLDFCLLATVANNVIDGTTDCIYFSSVNVGSISGNVMTNATRGLRGSAVTFISIGENVFSGSVTTPISSFGSIGSINNTGANPEGTFAQGNVTGGTTFTRKNGSFITATLTGAITVTLTNGLTNGERMTLSLTQDGVGGRVATWPVNFKKAGGALNLSAGAGATDEISMTWDGTNWIETSRSLNIS